MNTPKDLQYTKTDEWVKTEGNVATIGITDHAQDQLSDIVFVEINVSVGDVVTANDTGGTIESVKAAADVNVPVSGKVLEVNDALADKPETLNEDPYGNGWLYKIETSNIKELDSLLNADDYIKHCEEASH